MAVHMGTARHIGIMKASQQEYEFYWGPFLQMDLLTSKLHVHLKTLLPGHGFPQGPFHSFTRWDHQGYHHNPMVIKLATASRNQAVSSAREKLVRRGTTQLKSHGKQERHAQSRWHFFAFWASGVTKEVWLEAEINYFPQVNVELSSAG